MLQQAWRLTIGVLLLLATGGLVAQGGSIPHLHQHNDVALFNQEHDLTLLAGLTAHALEVDAAPILTIDAVTRFDTPEPTQRPVTPIARSADSRAPPSA